MIEDAEWEECGSCQEKLIPPKLNDVLLSARYERLGLLRPDQIKEVRERAGLTQEEMARFINVGERTYTRWESGRSIHNRSSDNLIRLAEICPELFVQIEAQRDPKRSELIRGYFNTLPETEITHRPAIAAHGRSR